MRSMLALVMVCCTAAAFGAQVDAPSLQGFVAKDDLDGMIERRAVRVLVPYSKTYYFIDRGVQRGTAYDLGMEFEKQLNAKLGDKVRPMRLVFIPTSRDRLLPMLVEGRGDIAAGNLTITPERQKLVDFSPPLVEHVKEVLVTRRGVKAPITAEDMAGMTVYVRESSSFYSSVQTLNKRLKAAKKKPIKVELADENLEVEDILEMLNAGLVDATIADSHIADFWAQIFKGIVPHPTVVLREEGQIAWAFRKSSPKLKAALDEFMAKNRKGTMTGNIILNRYLKNTKWARNATDEAEMKRVAELASYFQKYGEQYGFEWLLVVAQGYQESRLDQRTRSPVGAIGVMQLLPSTARDKSVGIPDIHLTEPNIHAGTKYLRFLVNEYFNEPGINPTDRLLFAFASYNGGPNRIARLRNVAAQEGLDANKWFENVELIVAREIGRETVQYVGNIYKYYVAYKLAFERAREREAAKQEAS